jgi:hypothetical protein
MLFTRNLFHAPDQIASYTTPKPESIETPLKKPELPPGMTPGMQNRPAPSAADENLKYEVPEGWKVATGNQFSLKAFEVVDGDEQIGITVSHVGGDLLANMNRWCDQVGAPRLTADELTAAMQPREVNGEKAMFIEMHSPEGAEMKKSILGIVVPDGDRMWFIKLTGSTALAERERPNLEAFAKSLSW